MDGWMMAGRVTRRSGTQATNTRHDWKAVHIIAHDNGSQIDSQTRLADNHAGCLIQKAG
jgi:hypothetical protein